MSHLPAPSGARADLIRRAEVAEVMADVFHTDLQTLMSESVSESTTRLELALEDIGWQRLAARMQTEFSRTGLERICELSRLMWRKNPLIRRAVNVRTYYTWAQGLTISADDEQIADLVDSFYTDPINQKTVFGSEATERLDRTWATDGQIVFVLPTDLQTGAVTIRTIPWTQLVEPVRNPEDAADIWFWRRRRTVNNQVVDELHPDIDHLPNGIRPAQHDGLTIRWDQPVAVERVDRLDGETWGVPEVYAALDWAKAYKEFLEDWASYVRALAKFAWRHKTKSGPAATRAATVHEAGARTNVDSGVRTAAGATAVGTTVDGLEPVKQSGAHVDATSGRPLALMVAAAMDMPYSILTGDADNSNLATAKTLDRPFELALTQRRNRWSACYQRLFRYRIEAAVRAPRGQLRGTVTRDEWGRTVVTLPDTIDPSVSIDWPPLVEHDIKDMIEAIVNVHTSVEEMPTDLTLRLILTSLGIDDADQVVAAAMDAAATAQTERQAEESAASVITLALEAELARLAA